MPSRGLYRVQGVNSLMGYIGVYIGEYFRGYKAGYPDLTVTHIGAAEPSFTALDCCSRTCLAEARIPKNLRKPMDHKHYKSLSILDTR